MSDEFYRAFEDRHRGSRELILSRLKVYLPFIEPLKDAYPDSEVVDLGCGRGEWLELLRSAGIAAKGVDLDAGMLSGCIDLGLSVVNDDAIGYLQRLPDNSAIAVSGFHIAEHLQFDDLRTLVKEALRVLVPAGLLILETPNPENILVGACNFYMDPTHKRPLPPPLLAFLPEYYGFSRTKVIRLQEVADLHSDAIPNLLSVIGGASPDYAVVAQKMAESGLLAAFSKAFDREYGLTLTSLAERFDAGTQSNIVRSEQAEAKAEEAQVIAEKAEAAGIQAEAIAEQAKMVAEHAKVAAEQARATAQQAEQSAAKSENKAKEAESEANQLKLIYASRCWRLTAPLRWSGDITKSVIRNVKESLKQPVRLFARWTRGKPHIKSVSIMILSKAPRLKARLHGILNQQSGQVLSTRSRPISDEELSPRARQIYCELQKALSDKNNGI